MGKNMFITYNRYFTVYFWRLYIFDRIFFYSDFYVHVKKPFITKHIKFERKHNCNYRFLPFFLTYHLLK